MYSSRQHAGQWNDKDCSEPRSYICEIRAEPQYDQQTPDWPACRDQQLASQGFVGFRENCYKVFLDYITFQQVPILTLSLLNLGQAEEACQALGDKVHLASLADVAEEALAIVLSYPTDVWIGLSKTDVSSSYYPGPPPPTQDSWTWSDGWPVQYTNWFDSNLNNASCASLHDNEAQWFQTDCDQTR